MNSVKPQNFLNSLKYLNEIRNNGSKLKYSLRQSRFLPAPRRSASLYLPLPPFTSLVTFAEKVEHKKVSINILSKKTYYWSLTGKNKLLTMKYLAQSV